MTFGKADIFPNKHDDSDSKKEYKHMYTRNTDFEDKDRLEDQDFLEKIREQERKEKKKEEKVEIEQGYETDDSFELHVEEEVKKLIPDLQKMLNNELFKEVSSVIDKESIIVKTEILELMTNTTDSETRKQLSEISQNFSKFTQEIKDKYKGGLDRTEKVNLVNKYSGAFGGENKIISFISRIERQLEQHLEEGRKEAITEVERELKELTKFLFSQDFRGFLKSTYQEFAKEKSIAPIQIPEDFPFEKVLNEIAEITIGNREKLINLIETFTINVKEYSLDGNINDEEMTKIITPLIENVKKILKEIKKRFNDN